MREAATKPSFRLAYFVLHGTISQFAPTFGTTLQLLEQKALLEQGHSHKRGVGIRSKRRSPLDTFLYALSAVPVV